MSPAVTVDIEIQFLTIPAPAGQLPDHRERFTATRKRAGLSMERAAQVLGMNQLEIVALEIGRRTFVDPQAWRAAIDLLVAAGAEGSTDRALPRD